MKSWWDDGHGRAVRGSHRGAVAVARAVSVLAVDVGGTKLAVAVVDATGRVVRAARAPTPVGPRADAETLWEALDRLVSSLLTTAGSRGAVEGVGIGCGGPGGPLARASSPSSAGMSDLAGSPRTRPA